MKKSAVVILMLGLSCLGFGITLYLKQKNAIPISIIMFGSVLLIAGIYLVIWMKVNKNMLDKGQLNEKSMPEN